MRRPRPRCSQADVEPKWWLDRDIHPSDYPDALPTEVQRLDHPYGAALAAQREDQFRAKLLCYECPIRAQCLVDGLWEEQGVWGGLATVEREQVRTSGKLRQVGTIPASTYNLGLYERIVETFKKGSSMAEIAVALNLDLSRVKYHIHNALHRARQRDGGMAA